MDIKTRIDKDGIEVSIEFPEDKIWDQGPVFMMFVKNGKTNKVLLEKRLVIPLKGNVYSLKDKLLFPKNFKGSFVLWIVNQYGKEKHTKEFNI